MAIHRLVLRWPAWLLIVACAEAPDALAPAGSDETVISTALSTAQSVALTQPLIIAQADRSDSGYRLGEDYRRLTPTQPTSSGPDTIEVAEFFSYGCEDCFSITADLLQWARLRRGVVTLRRIPDTSNSLARLHARAFYAAEALGKAALMHTAMFREIQVTGTSLDSEQMLADFFSRFDVSAEDFHTAFNSLAVHDQLERAEQLAYRYRVSSIPSIIVNGKYVSDLEMAGSQQALVDIADHLVAIETAN